MSAQELDDVKKLYEMLKEDLPDGQDFGEFLEDFEEFCI